MAVADTAQTGSLADEAGLVVGLDLADTHGGSCPAFDGSLGKNEVTSLFRNGHFARVR